MYAELKALYLKARKDKDKPRTKVLGLVVDKVEKLAKAENCENKDDFCLKAIKSELKQTSDALHAGLDVELDLQILNELLPAQKSKAEIIEIIETLIDKGVNNQGLIMRELKQYDDIDMKLASQLARTLLNKKE